MQKPDGVKYNFPVLSGIERGQGPWCHTCSVAGRSPANHDPLGCEMWAFEAISRFELTWSQANALVTLHGFCAPGLDRETLGDDKTAMFGRVYWGPIATRGSWYRMTAAEWNIQRVLQEPAPSYAHRRDIPPVVLSPTIEEGQAFYIPEPGSFLGSSPIQPGLHVSSKSYADGYWTAERVRTAVLAAGESPSKHHEDLNGPCGVPAVDPGYDDLVEIRPSELGKTKPVQPPSPSDELEALRSQLQELRLQNDLQRLNMHALELTLRRASANPDSLRGRSTDDGLSLEPPFLEYYARQMKDARAVEMRDARMAAMGAAAAAYGNIWADGLNLPGIDRALGGIEANELAKIGSVDICGRHLLRNCPDCAREPFFLELSGQRGQALTMSPEAWPIISMPYRSVLLTNIAGSLPTKEELERVATEIKRCEDCDFFTWAEMPHDEKERMAKINRLREAGYVRERDVGMTRRCVAHRGSAVS